MYSTDLDKIPRRPVIISSVAAQNETANWLEENDYKTVQDGDGLVWCVETIITDKPSSLDYRTAIWDVVINITADVGCDDLVETGVLEPKVHQRMLELIADKRISISLKPLTFSAQSMEDLKHYLVSTLPDIKKTLHGSSLIDIKRNLVARWLERSCVFGASA